MILFCVQITFICQLIIKSLENNQFLLYILKTCILYFSNDEININLKEIKVAFSDSVSICLACFLGLGREYYHFQIKCFVKWYQYQIRLKNEKDKISHFLYISKEIVQRINYNE